MEEELDVPTRTRLEPPAIRNERQDWHALSEREQQDVELYLLMGEVPLHTISQRARVYLQRHYGV